MSVQRRVAAPRIILRIVTSEYSAHHLQVLEGLEAVRKRPGMYIGSTDSRGLMHCVWEIIDNAVDEALGRQRQAHRHRPARRRQRRGARHRSRHPGRHRAAHRAVRRRGRLHEAPCRRQVRRRLVRGIGRSARRRRVRRERAVRAARRRGRSRRQDLGDVVPPRRARRLRRQGRAVAGFAVHALRAAQRAARRRARPPRGVTGTRIRYWADRQIFTKDAAFQLEELATRARQTAFLVPGLEIVVRDQRHERAQRDLVPLRRRNLGVRRVPRDGCRRSPTPGA